MGVDSQLLEQVVTVVKKVGEFQLSHFRNIGESKVDLKAAKETVSFVDVESERILASQLIDMVEGAGFFGEESGKSGSQELVWVVDPLDGTTNYLSGIDHFSISVALVQKGQSILGVVYQPYKDEWFGAVRGEGVLHNGQKIAPAFPNIESAQALFVTGFPYRSEDVRDNFFKSAPDILKLGRGIRRSGSAALDLTYVAAGWYHGFWETDLQPYDCAAALLFMEENGITVTNGIGEKFNMFTDRLMVAAAPKVHPQLLGVVEHGYGKLA